jgi:hypothetical protein
MSAKPYKGSKIIPVRFPAEELAAVEAYLKESESTRSGEPWTISTFIKKAVREKLDHIQRSRKSKRKPVEQE